MKTTYIASLVAGLSLSLAACQPVDDVDTTELARFRAAIPNSAEISAPAPKASIRSTKAVGDRAVYPDAAFPIVAGVNVSVGAMIIILEFVTSLPPTVYNSATKEYVWGPYPNNDGVGYIAAYIRDTDGTGDFRYEYAFLRGIDNDLAKLSPVIFGAATPDESNDDRGVGVTLWDFEADRAFNEAHDPDFDPAAGNRGRFAALYGNTDENDPDGYVVVAVLRDFIGENDTGAQPADLDYFYGHFVDDENTIDFLDLQVDADVTDDEIAEDVGLRMAFVNGGVGRAEADVTGGSMGSAERGDVTECWDAALDQTYIEFVTTDGGVITNTASEGDIGNCGPFAASLDDLGVPSLDEVPSDLMAALDDIATNGIPAE